MGKPWSSKHIQQDLVTMGTLVASIYPRGLQNTWTSQKILIRYDSQVRRVRGFWLGSLWAGVPKMVAEEVVI